MNRSGDMFREWRPHCSLFQKQLAILAMVLFLDGALFGSMLSIARATEENRAVSADSPMAYAGWTVALTFDDGPHKTCTRALLDGLRERNVRATFFLMGQSIEGNEELIRQMKADGHLIGSHGFSHTELTKAKAEEVRQSLEKTADLLEEITGAEPEYLRPPYGEWNQTLEETTDYITVFWSADSLDWKLQNTEQIVRRVEKTVENGDIILMHDVFPTSVEAALRIVDDLQAGGCRFVTVEELLID